MAVVASQSLLPCPYCGSPAEMNVTVRIPHGTGYDHNPRCTVPSCAGRSNKKWVNEDQAIAAWNTRSGPCVVHPLSCLEARKIANVGDPLWYEDYKHASQNGWLLADEVVGMLENPCTLVSYGATWRLWKYRPSDKERQEHRWP